MTRLLHGFTILAGTCALTLVVGCGGSSTPKVNCDGGACGDAKRADSGTKYDGSPVAQPDGPVSAQPDGPVTTLPDGPVAQPDSPVANQPDSPVANPDGAVANQPDGSTGTSDVEEPSDTTSTKADVQPLLDVIPAQKFDVKNDTSSTPVDAPALLFDVAQDIAADVAADVLSDASEAGDAVEVGEDSL
jgi:hypothetical protein